MCFSMVWRFSRISNGLLTELDLVFLDFWPDQNREVFRDSDWFLLRILDLNFQRNIGLVSFFRALDRLSKVAKKKKLTDIGFWFWFLS